MVGERTIQMSVPESSLEKGQVYRVIVRYEHDRIAHEITGVFRSARVMFKGRRRWLFESGAFEHLVDPRYVVSVEKVRRVLIW
jgi:hypothetical protein